MQSNTFVWILGVAGAAYAGDQVGKKLKWNDSTRVIASIAAAAVLTPVLMKTLSVPSPFTSAPAEAPN